MGMLSVTELYNLIADWSVDKKMQLVSLILYKITGTYDLKTIFRWYEEWVSEQ